MTYIAETRADTTKTKQLLEAADNKGIFLIIYIRKVANKTTRDRITNDEIRSEWNIIPKGEWVNERREVSIIVS